MNKLRAAVIGVGYLGRLHAQKYAALPDVDLIGVVDTDPHRAADAAARVGTQAYTDYRQVLDRAELVSIVVPTECHYEIAKACLEAKVHVLVEKPMTRSLEEASQLVELAEEFALVLQVGHLERFNPVILAVQDVVNNPRFIESHRLAPFKPRGTGVDVVLDLMIHDIDIILNLVRSSVTDVKSIGFPVLTNQVDIANARLEFANGCVANVTASRVSQKSMRKIRVFQPDAYISIDCLGQDLAIARKRQGATEADDSAKIEVEEQHFAKADPLLCEIRAFVTAVRTGSPPLVSGRDGKLALQLAVQINEGMKQSGG